jgi:hypothetical protein
MITPKQSMIRMVDLARWNAGGIVSDILISLTRAGELTAMSEAKDEFFGRIAGYLEITAK